MHQSLFRSKCAFTLIELLLVVAIMMILTTLMLPVIVKTKGRSHQLECLNQLRSTGMGFISYAHDHADRFPFQVSTKEGGTLELLKSANPKNEGDVYFAFRHFQSLSNEVAEVKILRCPVDFRTAAPSFQELKNENVSYFLAVTADPARADSLLAGDRNISETDGQSGSIVKMTAMSSPRWTRAGHEFKGNLLFAGGHVERTGNAGLSAALRSPTGPISVWMPVASPTPAASASSGQGSAGGGNADSDRGFSMLQNFFQTPASSSSASPSAPPAAIAQSSPARSPAKDDPPHVPEPASPPAVAEKPDRKSTRLNSSHGGISRMPSAA